MGGSEAETIRQPQDRLTGQPQERSLIAGVGSTPVSDCQKAGCRPFT
jgi:hypothetical protein